MKKENIVIYEDRNGHIELRADIKQDTIWATQEQISKLFKVSIPNINIHLKNIFKTRELRQDSVIKDFLITARDGKQYLTKLYNFDAIIAVGYRINSKKATQFRIWATGILREYIVEGYAINKHRLEESPESLIGLYKTITLLESMSHLGGLKGKITLKLTENLVPKTVDPKNK